MSMEFELSCQAVPIAAGVTDSSVGRKGSFIKRIIATVSAAATSACEYDDGGGANIPILAANTPIGVYSIPYEFKTDVGALRLTTAAGVTLLIVGYFAT